MRAFFLVLPLLGCAPKSAAPPRHRDEEVAKRLRTSPAVLERVRAQWNLDNERLMALPIQQASAIVRITKRPDDPEGAAQQRRIERTPLPPRTLPQTSVSFDKAFTLRLAAKQKMRGKQSLSGFLDGRVASIEAAPPVPAGWRQLGPTGVGGRTRSLLFSTIAPTRMWAASIAGGVWRSDHVDGKWTLGDDRLANYAVTSLVIDPGPGAADQLFAATGENFGAGDGVFGNGIYHYDGLRWDPIDAASPQANVDFFYVNRLAMSPDGGVLLTATDGALYRSERPFDDWVRVGGVPGPVLDVKFSPEKASGGVVKAVAGGKRGQVWFSRDGGMTWTPGVGLPLDPPLDAGQRAYYDEREHDGRVELAYAAAHPERVYASLNDQDGALYESLNGGLTYTPVVNGPSGYLHGQGNYANAVWAGDPTNEYLVVVGGLDLWRRLKANDPFVQISDWQQAPSRSAHADQHMMLAPTGTGPVHVLYVANDGGIYRADDIRTTTRNTGWTSLNDQYNVTQFDGASGISLAGHVILFAGTQDNGTLINRDADKPGSWATVVIGDGGRTAPDPAHVGLFYGEYPRFNLFRTQGAADAGAGPLPIDVLVDENVIPEANKDQCDFVAPFAVDPFNAKHLIGGCQSVWESEDVDAYRWSPIASPRPVPQNGDPTLFYVSAITIGTHHRDLVYVGYNDGAVFRSPPAPRATWGSTPWQRLGEHGAAALPKNRACLSITVAPDDDQHLFVTYAGFYSDNLWTSTDGGAHWRSLTNTTLPQLPIHSFALHADPKHQGAYYYYAGTESGVWESTNDGRNWYAPDDGPVAVPVKQLFWIGDTLFAATHGRGMYALDFR